jgi:predicted chitinase
MNLVKLASIRPGRSVPIKNLSAARLTELQIALTRLGYPIGDIDGLYGPKTRSAWGEAVADFKLDSPESIDARDVAKLQRALNKSKSAVALNFSNKKGTIKAIKSECSKQGIGLKTQIAYVLATVDHETAHTFAPVSEAFWVKPDPDAWRRKNLRYYPYYGRGYVQLTWQKNYAKYGALLGIDLVHKPDLALEPTVALFVLVHGFKTGHFTGRKLSDYIDDQRTDFLNARRCINGIDKQAEIAALAKNYLAGL